MDKKRLDIAFVSCDRSEEEFEEYYKEMPWFKLSFLDEEANEGLSKKYKVSGIPNLSLIKENGELINGDARNDIS